MLDTVSSTKLLAGSWTLAAAVAVSPSGIILGVGAVVYAVMLWKGQRGKILREQNTDLMERNTFLEKEFARIKVDSLAEATKVDAEQRALRHELKNQIVALTGQLEIEQAKHDMNAVTEKLEVALEILTGREEMFRQMAAGIAELATIAREDRTPTT